MKANGSLKEEMAQDPLSLGEISTGVSDPWAIEFCGNA